MNGVICETAQAKPPSSARFDVPTGMTAYDKYLGHNLIVDDLHALDGGGPL
jgi:hypothetical protein